MGFIVVPAIPAIVGTIGLYAVPTLIVGAAACKAAQSIYQRFQTAKREERETDGVDFSRLTIEPGDGDPRVDAIVTPIVYPEAEASLPDGAIDFAALAEADEPSPPSVRILPLETPPLIVVPFQKLTGAKKVAFDIAILAPKLFFSGVGWLFGNAIAPFLGAGLGDAIGTFIGCVISLGIELAIMKKINDPTISTSEGLKDFVKLRLKQALILSIASFAAGAIWGKLVNLKSDVIISSYLLKALLNGLNTAFVFGGVHLVTRAIASSLFDDIRLRPDRKNVNEDLKTSLSIIFPAQTAFAATSFSLCDISAFITDSNPLLAGAAVMIGGVVGYCLKSIFEKILEGINRRREIAKLEEFARSEQFAELLREATANSRWIRLSA